MSAILLCAIFPYARFRTATGAWHMVSGTRPVASCCYGGHDAGGWEVHFADLVGNGYETTTTMLGRL